MDFLSGFMRSEALYPQVSPIAKIAIRCDAAHLRGSFKGDRGFQIESGTSVVLKLDEECGQFVIVHELYPTHSFAFQFRVFNAFVVHRAILLWGRDRVRHSLIAQAFSVHPSRTRSQAAVPL
jgi:hypothetical protein